MQEQTDDRQQKLIELNKKYRERLRQLRMRSLGLVRDYLRKADEYEANKTLQKLKEGYGR